MNKNDSLSPPSTSKSAQTKSETGEKKSGVSYTGYIILVFIAIAVIWRHGWKGVAGIVAVLSMLSLVIKYESRWGHHFESPKDGSKEDSKS